MIMIIVLLVYIIGICVAYSQVQRWIRRDEGKDTDCQTLLMFSLFSWLIYPIYGIVWLIHKCWEG